MNVTSTVMTERKPRGVLTRMMPEALEAAKIAAAFSGERLMDYITRIVLEAARRDIEEGHRKRSKEKK